MNHLHIEVLLELSVDSSIQGVAGSWHREGAELIKCVSELHEFEAIKLDMMGGIYLSDLGKDLVMDTLGGLQ